MGNALFIMAELSAHCAIIEMEYTDAYALVISGKKVLNGARWKASTQMFELRMLQWMSHKRSELVAQSYTPKPPFIFWLSERGKSRKITSHHITDRMVYKSFCMFELWPAVSPYVMPSNSASQIGKGTTYAIKLFRKHLAHAYRKRGRSFWVVTYDFHDYFGSIPHKEAYEMIAPWLSSDEARHFLKVYFENFVGSVGIGIGGEPSQVIAIVYPQTIDHRVLQIKGVMAAGRYMDDGYVVCNDKQTAAEVIKEVREQAKALRLTLNEKRTSMFNMEKDTVTFLKKRTFLDPKGKIVMRLTRKNVKLELARLKYQASKVAEGVMPMTSVRESFNAWYSYSIPYQSYHARKRVLNQYREYFKEVPL